VKLDRAGIESRVPHAGRMCLLDTVEDWDESTITCAAAAPDATHPLARDGTWELLECAPAWEGNGAWDHFIAFAWRSHDGRALLIAVNDAPHQGQCFVRLGGEHWRGRIVLLRDRMGPAVYARNGDELLTRGLYLDLPPWGFHVFDVTPD